MNERILKNIHVDSSTHSKQKHEYLVSDVAQQEIHPALESIDLLENIPDNGILYTFASDPFTSNTSTVNDFLNNLQSHVQPNQEEIEVEKKQEEMMFVNPLCDTEKYLSPKHEQSLDPNEQIESDSESESEISDYGRVSNKSREGHIAHQISGEPLNEFENLEEIISGSFL